MLVTRAVFALLLAAPYFLISSAAPVLGVQQYFVRVAISAPAKSMAQLFYDDGTGYSEAHSSRIEVLTGRGIYDLELPAGSVRGLRLDPGFLAGRYSIEPFEILRPDGTFHSRLPLDPFEPWHQLSVVERSATQLVVESPPGSRDPFLGARFAEPLELPKVSYRVRGLLSRLLASWLLALVAVVVIERVAHGLGARMVKFSERVWSVCQNRPTATLWATAMVATVAAMYPLLIGRSLVAPNNGSVQMLYDHVPFVPGSSEFGLEDVRGSDVGAAMWAFVPYSEKQRTALRGGEWPLWMRNNGAGRPLWGQGQSFLLDPLHWLTLVGDPALGWDLKFIAHRLVFSAGIGIAAFLATQVLWASAVAAFFAPFVGLYAFRFNHPAALTPTYAAWVLAAWFALAAASAWPARARAGLWLALAGSLVLFASPPKEALITLAGCHLAGALSLVLARQAFRHRLVGLLAAAAAGVLTVLVTMPQWLVFLDTLGIARTAYDTPAVEFGARDSMLGLVLGAVTPASLQPGLTAIAAVFAVVCLGTPHRLRGRRHLVGCALGVVLLLGLAFGAVPASLLLQLPLVRNIGHFHNTVLTAVVVPALVLAASGLVAATEVGRPGLFVIHACLFASAAVILSMAGGLAGLHRFDYWLMLLVLGLSSLAPLVLAAASRYRDRAMPTLCFVLLLAAVLLPGGLHLDTGSSPLDRILAQPQRRTALAKNSPAVTKAISAFQEPTRAVGLGANLFPGSQALYDLEGIGGPDALALGAYEELLDAGGVQRDWGWRTLIPADRLEQTAPLLDLLNVGLLVGLQGQIPGHSAPQSSDGDDLIDVARRPSRWPRAYFVDGVSLYDSPSELMEMAHSAGRPIAGVERLDSEARALTNHLPDRSTTVVAATNYVLTANTTRFRIEAPGPGVAVLSETFVPRDFRVELNGKPATYFRLNHAFKGVVIPSSGAWFVRFEYRPARWDVAWMGAAVGALGMAVLAVASIRSRSQTLTR